MTPRRPRRPILFILCPGVLLGAALCLAAPALRADPAPPPAAPNPTDQPPPALPLPSPIPLGRDLLVSGDVDLRYRTAGTGRRDSIWLNEAEVDFARPLTAKGQGVGNIVVQLIGENPPDIPHGDDIQLGEAYLLYKLPLSPETGTTAYAKVGQFQIPFGLLAVYDPHLQILQPLYAQSLGIRTDWGGAISGRLYGYLNYDFAVTSGSGPNHADVNPNRVVTFRLGRTFFTRNGTVNVGGSLLQGRLPITDPDAAHPFANELAPSGRVHFDRGFVSKTRIAGDATLTFKNSTARGEAMTGADDANRVLGYYAEYDYHFSGRATATAARSLWVYPLGNSSATRESLGLTYAPASHLSVSALYEYMRDVPRDSGGRVRHRFTVQVLLRF